MCKRLIPCRLKGCLKRGGNNGKICKPGCNHLQTLDHICANRLQQIVQRLTGPSESDPTQAAPTKGRGLKRPILKFHERRQNMMRPRLEIVKPPLSFKPATSPGRSGSSNLLTSLVGTPSSILSKLTLQEGEMLEELAKSALDREEEEKAMRERRFYLHPSPQSRAGRTEPNYLLCFLLHLLEHTTKHDSTFCLERIIRSTCSIKLDYWSADRVPT
ncbi:hypothetical protein V6N13_133252 [Hibiscus sabdariffa]|uniref:Uncharacterized protein n=2 Tax=Hibiscus sabdariffa TaxID=183260 RepID=A0ABR1ZTR1_9ROSI